MRPKKRKMSPELFARIKKLQADGLKISSIVEIVKLSESTVRRACKADSLEGYSGILRGHHPEREIAETIEEASTIETEGTTLIAFRIVEVARLAFDALLSIIRNGGSNQ